MGGAADGAEEGGQRCMTVIISIWAFPLACVAPTLTSLNNTVKSRGSVLVAMLIVRTDHFSPQQGMTMDYGMMEHLAFWAE